MNTPVNGVSIFEHRLNALDHRVDECESAIVDLRGESGNNGRLGKANERIDTLKERLDKSEGRRWQVVMWIAGLIVTVITSAVIFGRWMGSLESDVEALKERPQRSRPFSPDAPAKDTP